MQEGFLNRLVGELNVHALGDGVGDALHSEEALVVSEGSDAENFSLIRVGCQRQGLRNVDACYLEQSSFKGALFLISGNGIQHGSCQCGTHQGQILVDRVDDLDGISLFCICRQFQKIQICRGEEGVMHALVDTHGA